MKRNTFLTLFTIFTISSLAMLDQGQAQTDNWLEPARKSVSLGDVDGDGDLDAFMSLGDGLQEACANGTFLYILCRQAGIEVGTPADEYMKLGDIKGEYMKLGDIKGEYMKLGDIKGEYMKLGDIKGEYMKLGDIKGEYMKLGDIKGEAMSAPLLGGVFMPNPPKEKNPIEIAVQQCCDDHTEVLFGGTSGFKLSSVIPGAGGVLADIAAACYQLRLEGMSDNESESAIGIGTGPGGVIDWENF